MSCRITSGLASVGRHQKLPPCQVQPVSPSSKTKAKPISDVGDATVIILERVKNAEQHLWGRRVRKMWGKQPCRHPDQWRRGRRCFRHQSSNSSAAHDEDYAEAAVPLLPMEAHRAAEISQPMEKPKPEKIPLKEAATHVEPMEEQPPGSSHDLCGTHAGPVCSWRTLPSWRQPTLEQLLRNCSLWEGPHAEAGKECATLLGEGNGRVMDLSALSWPISFFIIIISSAEEK